MNLQKDIYLLGSSTSINQLSQRELSQINAAPVRLALNKFMAFYDIAKIMPTHVYFADSHWNALMHLQNVFNVCFRDDIRGLTFVLQNRVKNTIQFKDSLHRDNLSAPSVFKLLFAQLHPWMPESFKLKVLKAPKQNSYIYVKRSHWLEGCEWASNLNQTLFHYRASLTDALNYLCIQYPRSKIKLVGVTLNSDRYFFESQFQQLERQFGFDPMKFMIRKINNSETHFAIQNFKGTNLLDKLSFVVKRLKESGSEIVSCDQDSFLVKKGIISYESIC